MNEEVILTCLPNGVADDGRARLTVFVTPRLTNDEPNPVPLGVFPVFAKWPERVLDLVKEHALSLLVEKLGAPAGSPPDPIAVTLDPTTPIEPELWTRLFDPDKVGVFPINPAPGEPAAGFQDFTQRNVRSFPANRVANQITALYGAVAVASPTDFPSVKDNALDLIKRLGLTSRNTHEQYQIIDSNFRRDDNLDAKGGYFHPPAGTPDIDALAFVLARRFYDRPGTIAPSPKGKPPIDFHGYVSFLGDYPLLLRRLGLAFDLLLDDQPPPVGRIRLLVDPVLPELDLTGEEAARPWTNYEIGDRRFVARPRSEGVLRDGSLLLENDFFEVHQLDIDGSALKTFDFAATAQQITDDIDGGAPTMTSEQASLPALRTGGFVIAQWYRDQSVVGQLGTSVKHEQDRMAGKPADLYAEDVTRGIRPQVQRIDGAEPWRSLTSRHGSYLVADGQLPDEVLAADDEGFVKGASATSALDESDDDLYLHEAVFGWDGWSLVVKRPGQSILDSAGHEVDMASPEAEHDTDFPLLTRFGVIPGSLPRLRFGQRYRFRAQAVDLAGNSVVEKALAEHVTKEQAFVRWDPIPSPAIVPRRRFTEGESLTRLVIRSTLGFLPDAYVTQERIKGLAGHTTPAGVYLVENRRWLAPPKSSVQLVEWHSMLDSGIGQAPDVTDVHVDEAFETAAREKGTYIDPGPGAEVVTNDPAVPGKPVTADMRGKPLGSGEYVIRDADLLGMPYLPDPASEGASFTTLPGDAATRTVAWPGTWPDRLPIELRVVDGGLTTAPPTAPQVGPKLDATGNPIPGTRVVTVALRQSDMVVVRLSSQPTEDGVDVSALLGPLSTPPSAAQNDALLGRNWLVTPYEEITLVHAVEKPLDPPKVKLTDTGVQRNEGETFAVLNGSIENHAKSTGRIDLDATWTEPIDDPVQVAPQDKAHPPEVAGQGHAGDFQLQAVENSSQMGRDDVPPTAVQPAVHKMRHEFRDTKHRVVTYTATATTRFREYFPPKITNDPTLITHVGPPTTVSIPSSRRPDPPDVQYVIPTFRWVDDVYPGLPAGTAMADLEPEIAGQLKGLRSARTLLQRGIRVDRLSRASNVRLPLVHRRVRKAGLRVYLGRPWYSSGDDELLAVVLPNQPYVLWPVDVANGLVVEATAAALADTAAEHLLGQEVIAGAGGQRLRASERLARGVLAQRDSTASDAPVDTIRVLTDFQTSRLSDALARLPAGFLASMFGGDPEKFVTRFGADPIWGSDPPASGPWIHQFPLRARVGTGLSLLEAPAWNVAAVGHRPQFDKDRGLWFCDIDIDAGTSYFPFVRLGLARYQPYSIPGCHLSRVVTPEWAQLMPDRAATLSRPRPHVVRVTLRGPAGYSSVATSVLGVAAGNRAGLDLSRFAVAQVERLPANATTDLAWQAVGPEVRLDLAVHKAFSDIEFSGTLEVPDAAEGQQLRLTLREYEVLETDASQADSSVLVPGPVMTGPFGVPISVPSTKSVRFRLVYASHLTL